MLVRSDGMRTLARARKKFTLRRTTLATKIMLALPLPAGKYRHSIPRDFFA